MESFSHMILTRCICSSI